MTNFQKAFCVFLSLCFFAVLALLPGQIIRRGNVFGQLPLYCFLEDKARSIPQSEDPETLEKIIADNGAYLGQKIREENQSAKKADNLSAQAEKESAPAKENTPAKEKVQEEEKTEQEETVPNKEDGQEPTPIPTPALTKSPEKETRKTKETEEISEVRSAAASIKPHPKLDLSLETLADYDYLLGNFFILDPNTATSAEQLNAEQFLAEDFTLDQEAEEPQILIYHSHSQETFIDSREGVEEDTIVGVGNYLTKLLTEDYGYNVIHVKEAFDMVDGELDRSAAYDYSGEYVEKVLEESMVTRILDSVENAAASKPKIDRFITRFARIYTPFVVALALATAIIPSLITGDWNKWVYTALTFLVISCPCALVLSVPLAFFAGIGAGSKKGILFKGGVSLEAMRHVRAVVMDKTGTITKGNFVVQQTVPAGAPGDGEKADGLLALAAACEKNSTHPIGTSIVSAAQQKGLEVESPSAVEEIAGQGIRATVAAGQVLCGNRKLMERFQVPLGDHQDEAYGTEVLVTLNGQFLGYLLIADTLKEDAAAAIGEIKGQGIRTVMLTGDAQNSAEAVARQAGVDEVHARLLPEEKLTELQKIRQKNGAVMFVGDGINDAPVLAGADVGAAMGSGADAAIEAADVVFMTSAMQAVPQSLSIARRTNRIAWQNVVFALVVKALVMVLGLAGYANMWAAVFADTGVAMICVINSIRILYQHK